MDIVPLNDTRFATAGHFGPTWMPGGSRVAVMVADTSGVMDALFLPRSTYVQDITPFISSLAKDENGHIWFAMHENAQVGPPSQFSVFEPNRIHIYKLDTQLNVICENVLNGFADDAYYYINRIRATGDGGYILLGGRRDMTDPSGFFQAWARKFNALDCYVGVSETGIGTKAVIFPNPGVEGFTLTLNGLVIKGRVELYDAIGRKLNEVPLLNGQAFYAATDEGAGLYHYHVVDTEGRTIAAGKCVKL